MEMVGLWCEKDGGSRCGDGSRCTRAQIEREGWGAVVLLNLHANI